MTAGESFARFRERAPDARFTDWLRAQAEPAWSNAVGHRFTRELAADRLPDAVYARYLVQDYLFLDVLVRVVALGIAKAPERSAQSRLAAFLAAVTSEENDYFLRSFEALGVPEAAWRSATPAPVTRRFRDLMLGAARDGGYAEILSVLLPAEWIYLSWAQAAGTAKPERFYLREWLELHRLPAFDSFVTWLREETDRQGATASPETQDAMARNAAEMARLEVAFFDLAYEGAGRA